MQGDRECTEPSATGWTARVLPERLMAESERMRALRGYAERLAEMRRYL